MRSGKALIVFTLAFALVLVGVVEFMNRSFEAGERDRYATIFMERLAIYQYLNEGNYREANELLSILLIGDAMAFEKIGDEINAEEYGLCALLDKKIKQELIAFDRANNKGAGRELKFNALGSDCAE